MMHPNSSSNRHHHSTRLKGYDYTLPGAYFVTLVTRQRDELFGRIADGVMLLSLLGQIARHEWFRSASIRKEILLHEDEFILMPNHLHAIVWLVGEDGIRYQAGIHSLEGVRPRLPQQGAYHAPLRQRRMPP